MRPLCSVNILVRVTQWNGLKGLRTGATSLLLWDMISLLLCEALNLLPMLIHDLNEVAITFLKAVSGQGKVRVHVTVIL